MGKYPVTHKHLMEMCCCLCAAEIPSTFPFDTNSFIWPTWAGCSAPRSDLSWGYIQTCTNPSKRSLCIYESFGMICDVWMAPQTSSSCPFWLGARLSCVRNPQRQKIGPTYFPRSFATLREVPHEADSTELCSVRNFHLMAHFKHLSSTWKVLSAEVDPGITC